MCHASCFAGSNAALGEGTVEGARQWSLRMLATCSVWARAATRPAWLTTGLVPSWGQRQHHQIIALEVVPFKGGRSAVAGGYQREGQYTRLLTNGWGYMNRAGKIVAWQEKSPVR